MEFEQQRGRLGQRQLGIAVDGAHLQRVEQFDAGKAEPKLDRGGGCTAGAVEGLERADRRQDRLGNAEQPHRQAGDDAERAFRADQQPSQVVAREDLRARPAVRTTLPSAMTAVRFSTLSRMVP